MIKPLFHIEVNHEALAELGDALAKAMQHIRGTVEFARLGVPTLFGPDWIESALKRQEEELALRRDEAARLTHAAHAYGYRDAKVVWLTDSDRFVFIHLDGLICADIPIMGEDYETALRWIRLESSQ